MLARFFSRSLSSLAQPHRTMSSGSSGSSSGAEAETDDVPFESLKPSADFVNQLNREEREKYKKTLNEFEIFAYMGKYVPRRMTDFDWKRTLQCESLNEKMQFWEYLAVTHRRKSRKDTKSSQNAAKYKEHMEEQQRIFKSGGMGYGPDLYQMITNPTRNQKRVNNCQGARVLSSMTAGGPRVALDLQYISEMPTRESGELGNQMQFVISENFSSNNPLVLDFVNAPSVEFSEKWLSRSVGYYTGSYQNQTILPDFSTKSIRELYGKGKKMIYLSSHARDVLDGPLTADVIGVCVSMNRKREALSAARRAEIQAYRLPIHRYVKWKSGPQFLPFPNLLNVLREVHSNGGDWKTALHNNISRRHLVDANEDEFKKLATLRRKAREEERRELAEAIMSATQG